jgi:hypothetical protein
MPYKNPEDKRRWEQEHREQRNAQRRQRYSESWPVLTAMPDPPPKETTNTWKMLASVVVVIGGVLLSVIAGASQIDNST